MKLTYQERSKTKNKTLHKECLLGQRQHTTITNTYIQLHLTAKYFIQRCCKPPDKFTEHWPAVVSYVQKLQQCTIKKHLHHSPGCPETSVAKTIT